MKYLIAGIVLVVLSIVLASVMSAPESLSMDPNPIAGLMSLAGVGLFIVGLVKVIMARI